MKKYKYFDQAHDRFMDLLEEFVELYRIMGTLPIRKSALTRSEKISRAQLRSWANGKRKVRHDARYPDYEQVTRNLK